MRILATANYADQTKCAVRAWRHSGSAPAALSLRAFATATLTLRRRRTMPLTGDEAGDEPKYFAPGSPQATTTLRVALSAKQSSSSSTAFFITG